jgi:hypothetical protein
VRLGLGRRAHGRMNLDGSRSDMPTSSAEARTTLTAYIEFDQETGLYVGIVPGIPGAYTRAESLDEPAPACGGPGAGRGCDQVGSLS